MSAVDVAQLAELLREAAAAEILPRFRRLDPGDIRQKTSATDLVTEADEHAERLLKVRIGDLVPGALFVGEESVAADPRLLDALDEAELAVVVDPVDGTANFAAGLPLFAVMASVVSRGETVAGIIYDPMGDDWFMAEKGGGAWFRRPDGLEDRVRVAAPGPLAALLGSVSMAFMPSGSRARIFANLDKLRIPANYRVAGHDYRLLAGGHTHFAAFNKLMPWDHLAGTLIVQEAGGYAARFDGSPYLPHHRAGGLLLAVDEASWRTLRTEVFTV
jgi:fructose-1,6-bisphosphatase/inositol monophosphatase family enzyme